MPRVCVPGGVRRRLKVYRRPPPTPRRQNTRVHPVGWRTLLRVFILYANPVSLSFGAALRKQSVDALRPRGHEINNCDLYAERFNPVMSEQERMHYHDVELNRAPIDDYADRLLAAEALVLIYPVWNEGFPAILKGFFHRVFIPGVSFNVGPDGAIVPICRSCESSLQSALMVPLALSVSCLATRPSGL